MSMNSYEFPYFIKPRYIYIRGTERQLFMKLGDQADLDYALRKISGYEDSFVIQRFLDGTEINIDFFCDANGQVKSIVPLKRLAMGITRGITRGEIVLDNRFDKYVTAMAEKMKFFGANQTQAYVDDDDNVVFTEINGRFSGSSVFVKEAGVDYYHYFVELLLGKDIEIKEKPEYLHMTCWDKPFYYSKSVVKTI
jgi:carbamoylphosphate synthase large subunit